MHIMAVIQLPFHRLNGCTSICRGSTAWSIDVKEVTDITPLGDRYNTVLPTVRPVCCNSTLNAYALSAILTSNLSPWNEIECGDHYMRQCAGFVLFDIASGQVR